MSTQVKFGLNKPNEDYTIGKIYFDGGDSSSSNPLKERIYLNGKDYSGIKEITTGYAVIGSLNIDGTDIAVKGFSDKADKVNSAVLGNLAGLDASGNITDSGSKAADFDVAGAAAAVLGTDSDTSSNNTVYGAKAAIIGLDAITLKKSQLGVAQSEPITGSLYGIAGLDNTGKVPSTLLPSYVDDVMEVRGGFYDDEDVYCPSTLGNNYSGEDENFNKDATSSNFNGTNKIKRSNLSNDPIVAKKPHGTYYLDFTTKKIYKCVPAGDGTTGGVWQVAFEGSDLEGKIYVVTNLANQTYRYGGSTAGFIEIIASPGTLDEIAEGSVNKHYTDAKAAVKANKVVSSGEIVGHIATLKSDGDINDSGKSIVTSFGGTASDDNIPTEKLVKDNLDLKAPIDSPTFTGTPKSVTPSTSDDSTKIATTAFVQANIADLVIGPNAASLGNIVVFSNGSGKAIVDSECSIVTSIGSSPSNYKIPTEKAVNDKLTIINTVLSNLVWD